MVNHVDGGWQELYIKRERYLKTICSCRPDTWNKQFVTELLRTLFLRQSINLQTYVMIRYNKAD